MNTEKTLSRKEFLANSSKIALGAVVGVAGFNLLSSNKAHAETKQTQTWPYPYTTLDPEVVRQYAHASFYAGYACCAGTFRGITLALIDAMGAPWTDFPVEIMKYGSAGISSWGTTCGAINGGSAMISLVVSTSNTALINELFGWYNSQALPTAAANSATYVDHPEIGVLPQSISGSPLCHASVSQWCFTSGFGSNVPERSERCARLAGDIAAKTVEILNAHFASTFVGTFTDPAGNADCTICHGTAADNNIQVTHMECVTCHSSIDLNTHGTKVNELGGNPTVFELENAYPNPFFSSTTIKFSVPKDEKIRLEIYDIKGLLVNSLIDSDVMKAGIYEISWNGTNNSGNKVTSGIYFARLTSGSFMKSIKINLTK